MMVDVDIDEEAGIAVARLAHLTSQSDGCAALNTLLDHPEFKPGMDIIVVLEAGAAVALTGADIRGIVGHAAGRAKQLGADYRLAIVAASATDFGIGRMYGAWSNDLPRESRVFYSLAEARKWITSGPTEDMPAASGIRRRVSFPSRSAVSRWSLRPAAMRKKA